MPRERFRILSACGFRRHPHARNGAINLPPQLARVGDARVGGRIGTKASHRVEGIERRVILAELDVRVADDAVVPRILRVRVHRARADLDRFAEPVLRHVDGAEHSQRIVVIRPALECACENLLRLERVAAVGFEARTAQRIGRKHGSFASDAFRRRRILTRVDRRRDRSDSDRGDDNDQIARLYHNRRSVQAFRDAILE